MVGKISEIATSGSPLQGADRFEATRDPTGTPSTVYGDIDMVVTYANSNLSLGTARITSGTFADARIAESNVTQHRDAVIEAAVNKQTGTTYTLALTDAGDVVTMNNASANTVTIPTNASVAFPIGTVISIIQYGAGATTVAGDTGVTVNGVSAGSGALSAQYSGVSLVKFATDEWLMNGDHAAVA